MAFPQVIAASSSHESANVTTHTVDIPAVTADDLILIYVSENDATVFTQPTGYTLKQQKSEGSNAGAVFALKASATAGASTVTFDTSAATQSAHQVLVINQWSGDLGSVEVSAGLQTSSATPDPDSVTASWGSDDNLFIASSAIRRGTSQTLTGYPANYSGNQSVVATTTGSGGAQQAVCTRELAAATDDPGTFTLDVSTNAISFTTVVRGPLAAPSFAIDSAPTTYREGEQFSITVSNPATVPTLANTKIMIG